MMELSLYNLILPYLLWPITLAMWGYLIWDIWKSKALLKKEDTAPTLQTIAKQLSTIEQQNRLLAWLGALLLSTLLLSNTFFPHHPTQLPATSPVVTQPSAENAAPVPSPRPPEESAKPVTPSEPLPATASSPPPASPPTKPTSTSSVVPFSDITEFNERDSKQQATMDWLKQRYENWFIAYYFLQKCGKASKDDFDLIRASLHNDIAALHTESGNLEDNIMVAANGSYNELYASSPCQDERVKAIKDSYETYMRPLRPAVTSQPHTGTPVKTP